MTTDSQIVVGRAAVGSKRKPKKTLLFPCLKETTDIVYRTGKLPENRSTCTIKINKTKKHPENRSTCQRTGCQRTCQPARSKQTKQKSIQIAYELMKQKFNCTITLLHNTHQKLLELENLGMLGIFGRREISTRYALFDRAISLRFLAHIIASQKYHLHQLLC